jgi:hypothetical protein
MVAAKVAADAEPFAIRFQLGHFTKAATQAFQNLGVKSSFRREQPIVHPLKFLPATD